MAAQALIVRARRIKTLRAEVSHRLEEIKRLVDLRDPQEVLDALAKAPSIPLREEADFGSDLWHDIK